MGFFKNSFKRKTKTEDGTDENIKESKQPKEPEIDRQRIKKIKNMKKKFDETVWNSVLDIMKTDIPDFVMVEDYDDGTQGTKYVLLGFDTKIVDDFSNKADDDIGSIMTAIKSSMDAVIENALFDSELILLIPTEKTIHALEEFEETFDLKFSIIYVNDNHDISIETYIDTKDPIYTDMNSIHEKIKNHISVEEWIRGLQSNIQYGEINELTGEREIICPDESKSEAELDETPEEQPGDEAEPDDEEPDDDEDIPDDQAGLDEIDPENVETKKEQLAETVTEAANKAAAAENRMHETKNEIAGENPDETPAEASADTNPEAGAMSDKLAALKNATAQAVSEAEQDPDIAASNLISPTVSTFDVQEMDSYITRKYYSDELDLEISSQPFDAMFLQNNTYVPFVEDTSGGWLAGQVNNLRRDANARLAKLHQENLLLMRERFMLIINKHCEQIVKAVATDDPKSRFGYALKAIRQVKEEQLAGIAQTAEAYKREKEKNYQDRLQQEMANGANVAKINFINKWGKEHEREMRDIEMDLRSNIESEYVAAYENLQKERKNEAKRQLDVGITDALKLCADEYTKMMANERAEYVRLQQVITNFENENMAAEHTRIMALTEQQRRSNEVVNAQNEYDAKLDAAKSDFEMRLEAVRAEIAQNNAEHENHIQAMQDAHEKDMQTLRDRHAEQMNLKAKEVQTLEEQLSSANNRIEVMTKKYAELDEKVGRKYANQIDMLKSEREAWTDRANQIKNLHRYTDKIKISVMVVGVAAALGIGILIGCRIMAGGNDTQTAPIVHYYELDEDMQIHDGMSSEIQDSEIQE